MTAPTCHRRLESTLSGRSRCGPDRPLCIGKLPAISGRFRRTRATRSAAGQRSVVLAGNRPVGVIRLAKRGVGKRSLR